MPTLRDVILRERCRASRLPSLRSALRGPDARQPLPRCAVIGASEVACHLSRGPVTIEKPSKTPSQ
jgi:hypothetical protein